MSSLPFLNMVVREGLHLPTGGVIPRWRESRINFSGFSLSPFPPPLKASLAQAELALGTVPPENPGQPGVASSRLLDSKVKTGRMGLSRVK